MKRLLFIPLLLVLILSACKKNDISSYTNPHIERFYFNEHSKIKGIENLTFTIDTISGLIINKDSAAFNCNFSKVVPVVSTYETLSSIAINGITWNKSDTLDMRKPITITTVAGNKKRTATYTVKINKHTVEPDSIVWSESIINENNITSIKAESYNNKVYLFFTNNKGETKIYSASSEENFTQIYSQTDLDLNFSKSTVHNEKCFATSTDNKSLYYINLADIASGFSSIELPENSEIVDLWGIINGKLFATIKSDVLEYMSYDGNAWAKEDCNVLDELNTVGSAKICNNNSLFIISGNLNGNLTNNVLSTQDGNYWINTINQSDTLLYQPVQNACVIDYYDYFYLLGGTNQNGEIGKYYYSRNDGYTWQPLKSYQVPSGNFSCKENISGCSLGDYIYIANCSNSSNIEIWKGKINKADFIIK